MAPYPYASGTASFSLAVDMANSTAMTFTSYTHSSYYNDPPRRRETLAEMAKRIAESRVAAVKPRRVARPLPRPVVRCYHNAALIPLPRSNC